MSEEDDKYVHLKYDLWCSCKEALMDTCREILDRCCSLNAGLVSQLGVSDTCRSIRLIAPPYGDNFIIIRFEPCVAVSLRACRGAAHSRPTGNSYPGGTRSERSGTSVSRFTCVVVKVSLSAHLPVRNAIHYSLGLSITRGVHSLGVLGVKQWGQTSREWSLLDS